MSVTLLTAYQTYTKGSVVSLGDEVESALITQGIAVAAPEHLIASSFVALQHGAPVAADFPTDGGFLVNVDTGLPYYRTTGAIRVLTAPLDPARYDRAPTRLDNAARGYTVSSRWQNEDNTYQPVVAVDTVSAPWAPLAPLGMTYPVDVLVAANVHSAVGTIALKKGFTGPALDLNVVVATVDTTFTIDIGADGELDKGQLALAFAAADSGSQVEPIKLYDQSGSGNHYVKTGTGKMNLVYDQLLRRYVIAGEISAGALTNPYMRCATGNIPGATHSMIAYGRGVVSQAGGAAFIGAIGDHTSGNGVYFGISDRGTFQNAYTRASAFTGGNLALPAAMELGPSISMQYRSGTSITTSCNDKITTLATSTGAFTCTGAYIGTSSINFTTNFAGMRLCGWVVGTTTPTSAQADLIRRGAFPILNIRPQVIDQVVLCGDSRMTGYTGRRGESIGMALSHMMKERAQIYSLATSGETTVGAVAASGGITAAVARYNSSVKNVAVVLYGFNDFFILNLTPDQSAAKLRSAVATLKAAGYYVIVIAELATTSTTNGVNTKLPLYRTEIVHNGITGADEIIDVSADVAVATPSNNSYYTDGIHLANSLDYLLASAVLRSVDAAIQRDA